MGLRTKITLALLLVLLSLAGATVAVLRIDMHRQLDFLEKTETSGDLRRLLVSLGAQMMQVDSLLGSWANWTEFYKHAKQANPDFVEQELSVEAFRVAQLAFLLRITPEGEVVDRVEVPQNDGITPMTTTLIAYKDVAVALSEIVRAKTEACGLMLISKQLAFVCYRPLHVSDGSGPAHGSVLIGRWLDTKMLAQVKAQTNLDFELVTFLPKSMPPVTTSAIESPLGQGDIALSRMDNMLEISFPLTSLFQQHIGELRMHWPRRSVALARDALALTQNVLLGLVGIAGLLIIVLVDLLVVRRLRQLKSQLGAMVQDRDWSGTIKVPGNDEVAELAEYANGLMCLLRVQMLELRELSTTDALTQLPNRRIFEARLSHLMAQHARSKRQACLVLIDIDNFKRYNDTYGHPAGDAALKRVAEYLRKTLRRSLDLPARMGGEEFGVVLDETTLEGGLICAETIRKAILEAAIEHTGNPPLGVMSVSCGVSALEENDTAISLYQRADKALYVAKVSGRNRVSCGC